MNISNMTDNELAEFKGKVWSEIERRKNIMSIEQDNFYNSLVKRAESERDRAVSLIKERFNEMPITVDDIEVCKSSCAACFYITILEEDGMASMIESFELICTVDESNSITWEYNSNTLDFSDYICHDFNTLEEILDSVARFLKNDQARLNKWLVGIS